MAELATLLKRLNLEHLHKTLVDNHVTTVQDLMLLDGPDMLAMGCKIGDKNRILKWQGDRRPGSARLLSPPTATNTQPSVTPRATTDDVDHYRAVFSKMDTKNKGELDFSDLVNALKELGTYTTVEAAKHLFELADADGSGAIDFLEFVVIMNRACHGRSEMSALKDLVPHGEASLAKIGKNEEASAEERARYLEVFDAIDVNGDKKLEEGELIEALKALGSYTTESAARSLFAMADKDGSGSIDFEEFVELMQNCKSGRDGTDAMKDLHAAGPAAMEKLASLTGIKVDAKDALEAKVEDRHMDAALEAASSPPPSGEGAIEGSDERSLFVLQILLLDPEVLIPLVAIVFEKMLADLDEAIGKATGVTGYAETFVNKPACIKEAIGLFIKFADSWSHKNPMKMHEAKARINEIHAMRKALILVACDATMKDIREHAASLFAGLAVAALASEARRQPAPANDRFSEINSGVFDSNINRRRSNGGAGANDGGCSIM